MARKLNMTFKHVDGFIPGKHCTQVEHHMKGELAELPPEDQRHPRARYVCKACLPRVLSGIARSEAAKRGAETRRIKRGIAKRLLAGFEPVFGKIPH